VLLGRGRLAATSSISAEEFCSFFTKKVDVVRSSTAGSPLPLFTDPSSSSSLSPQLNAILNTDVEEVESLIRQLLD
jgi:hypothetical protein